MRRSIQANAAAYYGYFFLSAVTVFITSPLLVASIGPAGFGAFKSVQKALDIVSVADGRAGQALKWVLARLIPSNNSSSLKKATSGAAQTALLFTPLLMLVVAALTVFAPRLFDAEHLVSVETIRLLVAVLGANLVLAPLMSVPDAVLVGSNRGYISTISQAFWFLATNIALVVIAKAGYGLVGFGLVVLAGSLANAVCVLLVAIATTKWFRWQRPDAGEFRSFLGLSGWLLAWAGVEKFLLSAEIILIAALIGARDASKYVFASYTAQLFLAVLLLSVSSAAPSLGQLLSRSKNAASAAMSLTREGIFALAVCSGCLLLALNKSFVILWMGESNYIGDAANTLIGVLMLQAAMIRCDAQLHDLSLDVKQRSLVGIATTVLTLAGPVVLYLAGAATTGTVLASVFAARLILSGATPLLMRKAIDIPKIKSASFFYAIVMLTFAWATGLSVDIHGWVALLIGAIACCLVLAPFGYFFLLSSEGRSFARASVTRVTVTQ